MDRLVSVVVACALSACSLSISAPAANRRRNQLPECDTGKGLVAIDALAAVGFGVGGLAALSEEEGIGAIALVGAALFTAAALHGSNNADKCKAAIEDYGKEMAALAPPAEEITQTPRRRRRPAPPPPDEIVEELDPSPPVASTPKPEPRPEPKPEPEPRPARGVRDWSQFWREVP